jgi:hypothetical protein
MKSIIIHITLNLKFIFWTWGENDNTNKRNFEDFADNQQVHNIFVLASFYAINYRKYQTIYHSLFVYLPIGFQ